jgi:hypothetical protein
MTCEEWKCGEKPRLAKTPQRIVKPTKGETKDLNGSFLDNQLLITFNCLYNYNCCCEIMRIIDSLKFELRK